VLTHFCSHCRLLQSRCRGFGDGIGDGIGGGGGAMIGMLIVRGQWVVEDERSVESGCGRSGRSGDGNRIQRRGCGVHRLWMSIQRVVAL